MGDYSNIILKIPDNVQEAMETKGITEDEIKNVIGTAEESGKKLRDEDGSVFLAKLKINETHVYAKYQIDGEEFEVLSAYNHKTNITGW